MSSLFFLLFAKKRKLIRRALWSDFFCFYLIYRAHVCTCM